MAPRTVFALLKPDSLDTRGYAYGKTISEEQEGQYDIERVASGRWKDLEPLTTQRKISEVDPREVTEAEALSGIGTYVGSTLCVARVPQGCPKVWDYGTVVGYTWKEGSQSGVLQVTFGEGTSDIEYSESEHQDLTLETYALQPCRYKSVTDIMPSEMRAIHVAIHAHFNGVGQAARRSSVTVLRKVGMEATDEHQVVPVYNLEETRVVYLRVAHILNFVFYREGKRRAPPGVIVPRSLFAAQSGSPAPASEHKEDSGDDEDRLERLYDSGDDSLLEVEADESSRQVSAKRSREEDPGLAPTTGDSRLIALRRRLGDDPDMVRDIDQLLALRQADLGKGSSSSLVVASGVESKAQFKPSRQQVVAHSLLVNGTYSSLDSQLFVETMQSKSKEFDYLPHPGAARGFYGWDFGFRGLSVMHFSPVDVDEERDYRRRYDMTDFSVKNKLPEPPKATAIIDVVAALEVLALLVKEMYQPMVGDLIDGARRFLLLLRKTKSMTGPEAVPELVAWIDDSLERFRSCLVHQDVEAAAEVKASFRFNHESYARVVQRVTSLKVEAVLKSTVSRKVDSRQKIQQRRSKGNHHAATIPVPPAVVAALPIRKGKKLCMKFLSVEGCPGEGDTCIFDYRGHFVPSKLPGLVKSFISKNYGGLKDTKPAEDGGTAES